MPHTGLAVIEARWWSDGNASTKPLFEVIFGIVENNPHFVRYDMFSNESSLSLIISDIAKNPEYHSIYIGAHGNENAIGGLGDATVSRTQLRNMLRNSNTNQTIKGLYFGSCLICTRNNASFWLTQNPTTGLDWIAGYTKSVDWIDSSAIDMIFWSKYLEERRKNRSRRRNKRTDIEMIKEASSDMKRLMPTIFNELGFNIYHLDTGGALTTVW